MKSVLSVSSVAVLVLANTAVIAQRPPRDAYVRYELQDPVTGSFRIVTDLTLDVPGAKSHVEPLGKGIVPGDVSAVDLMTGAPLTVRSAPGSIQVELARPVPAAGETRIRLTHTERDPASYRRVNNGLTFSRALVSKRGSVTLPSGYELLGATVPVQVLELPDGRIAASFMNGYPLGLAAPITIHAGRLRAKPAAGAPAAPPAGSPPQPALADAPAREQPMNQIRVSERALQDREIVYFLKEPETHAFAV